MTALPGLRTEEAQRHLAQYGPNEIIQKAAHSAFEMFLSQFKSPLVILLFIATGISFALGDILESALILAIVILNAILGFFQEYRAERALEALKKIAVSTVRVLRDGVQQELDSKLLVPGDVVILGQGLKVPADGKIIDVNRLFQRLQNKGLKEYLRGLKGK